jgi:hypothetical protein
VTGSSGPFFLLGHKCAATLIILLRSPSLGPRQFSSWLQSSRFSRFTFGTIAKFAKLANVLKDDLTDTKVYKIGDEPEKTIIVVGKTNGEKCAGVKTTVVET